MDPGYQFVLSTECIKNITWAWMVGGGREALLDHLILIIGYVSRQAAGQEDPDELERNTETFWWKTMFFP